MSDDEIGAATSDENRPAPSATSRARRIGGRPAAPAERPREESAPRPAEAPPAGAAPSGTDAAAPPARRRRPGPWTAPIALAVALAAVLGLLVVFSRHGYWDKPDPNAVSGPTPALQQQVLAAGKSCFAALNSYDYRNLDAALAAGLKCTTGSFTSDYRTVFTRQIKVNAPTAKAAQSAQVNKAGIASISPDGKQWVLLVFGQLQVTNVSTGKDTPRVDPVGAVVTMDKVGESWLVAKVDTDTGNSLGN